MRLYPNVVRGVLISCAALLMFADDGLALSGSLSVNFGQKEQHATGPARATLAYWTQAAQNGKGGVRLIQMGSACDSSISEIQASNPWTDASQCRYQVSYSDNNGISWTQPSKPFPVFANGSQHVRGAYVNDSYWLQLTNVPAYATTMALQKYGLQTALAPNSNFLLLTTTVHTWTPDSCWKPSDPHYGKGDCSYYDHLPVTAAAGVDSKSTAPGTWSFRLLVLGTKDDGTSMNYLGAIANTAGPSIGPTTPYTPGNAHGLWSTFPFLRSDGLIQVYFDDEDLAARNGENGWQFTGELDLKSLSLTSSAFGAYPAQEVTTAGTEGNFNHGAPLSFSWSKISGTRSGMPTVTEICLPNTYYGQPGQKLNCKMTMMVEDVKFDPVSGAAQYKIIRNWFSNQGGGDSTKWSESYAPIHFTDASGKNYSVNAPYHIRSKANGLLYLTMMTDFWGSNYTGYEPPGPSATVLPTTVVAWNSPVWVSADDGKTWVVLNSGFATQNWQNCSWLPAIHEYPTQAGGKSYLALDYTAFVSEGSPVALDVCTQGTQAVYQMDFVNVNATP